MKVIVPVKKVVDPTVKVRANAEQTDVAIEYVKMSMNPFDEVALEQAILLKEQGKVSEVIAVSCGSAKVQDVLRTALAMGADRAIFIQIEQSISPLVVAKLLSKIVQQQQVQLVIAGKQAIDDDAGQVGQMLAALLDYPQATFASEVDIIAADTARVVQEVDGGFLTVELSLPAVVTTDLRLNEPRFVSLPKLMQAKRKPLEVIAGAELGVDLAVRHTIEKVYEPELDRNCQILPDVAALVAKLKQHAKQV